MHTKKKKLKFHVNSGHFEKWNKSTFAEEKILGILYWNYFFWGLRILCRKNQRDTIDFFFLIRAKRNKSFYFVSR